MYREIIFLTVLLSVCECKMKYTLSGAGWKNELQSCNSWGEYEQTYSYVLPTIASKNMTYKDIDELTTVVAYFSEMNGHTKAVSNGDIDHLLLNVYTDHGSMKEFYGKWGYTAVCGWGKQATFLKETLKIFENGEVKLENYVYAASWGAVSCATVKAYVSRIELIV